MEYVFCVRDPNGNGVALPSSRWQHIVDEHPNLASRLHDVRETAEHPHVVQVRDDAVNAEQYRYYRRFGKGYVLLVVKEGKPRLIWTGWYCRRIRRGGRYEWLSIPDSR